MKPKWMMWLFVFAIAHSQQRLLVSPNSEIIPLKRNERMIAAAKLLRLTNPAATLCGNKFTFGYPEELFPPNANFGAFHKDVMGEWFIAPASGTIDTIFWEALGSVGALDSLVSVRIFKSNIYPGRGPGFRPYRPPCGPWGYYPSVYDSDQGITPFKDEATDTQWVSTTRPGDYVSFDPLGKLLWGFTGVKIRDHAGKENFVSMNVTG